MPSPISVVRNELLHFSRHLNEGARRLVWSDFSRSLALPLVEIFITAFIWRTTGSLESVALYAGARFAALPLAMWINGYLLRYITIGSAMWLGATSAGVVTASVAFFSGARPLLFLTYGILNGLGWGLYWANRNYLALQETRSEERRYFFAITHTIVLIAGVVVPFLGGWFITAGAYFEWFELVHGYWILFALSLLFMLLSAHTIATGRFESPIPHIVNRIAHDSLWSRRHILSAMRGAIDINKLLVPLLIVVLLGNEGVLGTLTAAAALLTSFVLYFYGRTERFSSPAALLISTSAIYAMCAVALFIVPNPFNVIIFTLAVPILLRFYTTFSDQLMLNASDDDMNGDSAMRYSLIFDNELFLNAGRIGFLALVVGIGFLTSPEAALLAGPLAIAATQFVLLAFFFRSAR